LLLSAGACSTAPAAVDPYLVPEVLHALGSKLAAVTSPVDRRDRRTGMTLFAFAAERRRLEHAACNLLRMLCWLR